MNYRHAYHAGNFADVVKHAVLARVLVHLRDKPAPFRVIDTHAGAGLYDLAGVEAGKTGEWRNGIGQIIGASLDEPVRALLAPYLDAVAACNPGGGLARYPGSPALAQALLRSQDRLVACELEPQAAVALHHQLRGDNRTKAVTIDGWTALNAYVPPPERRGLVLIDPPFERPGEFGRLAQGLAAAHRKWATGIYLLWYPVKDMVEIATFARKLTRLGLTRMLRAELMIESTAARGGLRGSGMIVVNPPWTLHGELKLLLPALRQTLAGHAAGGLTLDWLSGETSR
jgi:23S rRNA (adenine2030-N6)-methyltransferase